MCILENKGGEGHISHLFCVYTSISELGKDQQAFVVAESVEGIDEPNRVTSNMPQHQNGFTTTPLDCIQQEYSNNTHEPVLHRSCVYHVIMREVTLGKECILSVRP